MEIPFVKMSGAGNDFVVIDNRRKIVSEGDAAEFARVVCARRTGVGADGVLLIEESDSADFRMRVFNPDGSEAEMCGNGARCAAAFCWSGGIAEKAMKFETLSGMLSAWITSGEQDVSESSTRWRCSRNERVKVELTRPSVIEEVRGLELSDGTAPDVCSINTGVPHVVMLVEDVGAINVVGTGREIRLHERFAPEGANADFVEVRGEHDVAVRTYERGVEDETLACGTGSVASVLVAAAKGEVKSPVNVLTRGGEILAVHFDGSAPQFDRVYLEGCVRMQYEGRLGW